MQQGTVPENIYEQEKRKRQQILSSLKKRQATIGWARLLIVITTLILSFQLFNTGSLFAYFVVVAGFILFLFAVSFDLSLSKKINTAQQLLQINEDELQFLKDDYYFRYNGTDLSPATHEYAHDLDVFGKASLFQYINRCNSEQGKHLLAQNLLQPLPVETIYKRQEAIKELTPLFLWRQHLQALSLNNPITTKTELRINEWLNDEDIPFVSKAWTFIIPAYTFLTIASFVAMLIGWIPLSIFSPLFIIYFLVAGSFSKKATKANAYLTRIVKEVETIHLLMQWIENKNLQASLLQTLQQQVKVNNQKASVQIKKLQVLLNLFDVRLNVLVFIFLNSFSLWDVRQVRALNKWKELNKDKVCYWFQTIAAFEVLNSLATLHFNKPQWCFPQFVKQYFTLQTKDLGHPLLPDAKRVTSDFFLSGKAKIALITGSNMAGKSTFLRTLGCNVVLAQMGAPVCAEDMILSSMQLISSMRIADNLAENTSTFYAELKKLKTIIEAVNRHEPLFILLDEILRGTNSLDRHTGSQALIKQLVQEKAVAVIATHDIDLASLEDVFPSSIENYHFDVQVEGEELYFDYQLKDGVCTSLNASILMKKIGINMD